jgi:ATP-dependent 26S proteasome regulatory subunit
MESREDILVIAATNRKEAIDEALLRPGRLDKTITVSTPDTAGQAEIFEIHTDSLPTAESVTGEWFTTVLPSDLTGAQIRQVCEEAFRHAVQDTNDAGEVTLNRSDFRAVLDSLSHVSGSDWKRSSRGFE